jgi:hypothetical protein
VGREIFESVPDVRVGFQRKDLAVDPEAFDPVTAAELQCRVQSIGVGHTEFGKVCQLMTARKSPQIFCSGSPEFYGFFPEYATKSETDHHTPRDLCKTPLFAQFLRQSQIAILEILNVFTPRAFPAEHLWLKFSPSLNLNKNEHFPKVSPFNPDFSI